MQRKRQPRRGRKPGRRIAFTAVILVIVVVALFAVALPTTGLFTFLIPPAEYQVEDKFYGAIEEALRETGEIRPTDRPDYLPAEVYTNLPDFPEDFYYLDEIITFQEGIVDLTSLEEEYWKQPEFFPTWESNGVERMKNPSRDRSTIWGWGAYPADQGFATSPGAEFTTATFFHTSWMVQSYQGMKLVPVFPGSGTINGIFVSSPDAEKYFTVTVNPELILLGPAFPRFDSDWSYKIVVTIKVDEATPPGDYLFGVNPRPPPLEAKREWTLAHKLRYVDAGTTGVQRPYFQMLVTVLPPETE